MDKALNYDLTSELYEQIKAESERLGIPIAGFMRMLAVQYFEKREAKLESSESGTKSGPGTR